MSLAKTVGAGVAWNTVSVILGKGLIFLNIFLILRYLSVYEYGFTELVMSIVSTVGIVLLPGLTNTVIADMSVDRGRDDKESMNRTFYQYFYLSLVLGLAAWAVLFFGSHPVARAAGNPYVAQFLVIIAFQFLISPFRTMTLILATVTLRYRDQSFYGVLEELCKLFFLIILVVLLKMGIHGLIFAMVLSQFAAVVMYLPRTLSAFRYFADSPAKGRIHFWNMLREHRKWSIGSSYIGTIAQNARIWIIKVMLGTEAVGLFAFSYGILSHIVSLLPLPAVVAPLVPRYVDKQEQLIRILRASIKLQLLLALGLVAGAFLFTHAFVVILFPKYTAAIPLIYILVLSLISNSIVSLFIPVFAALKEQRSLLFSNVFKLLLGLVILPLAILAFGILGMAVELVLTTLINSIERYYRLKRILPAFSLPLKDLLRPDPYEKEAMQTVRTAFLSRMPQVWPITKL